MPKLVCWRCVEGSKKGRWEKGTSDGWKRISSEEAEEISYRKNDTKVDCDVNKTRKKQYKTCKRPGAIDPWQCRTILGKDGEYSHCICRCHFTDRIVREDLPLQ